VIEKDEVRDDLGGILQTPPCDVEGVGGEALALAIDSCDKIGMRLLRLN